MKNKILLISIICLFTFILKTTAQENSKEAKSVAYISLIGKQADLVLIVVYNSSGKEIYTKNTQFEISGINNFAIDPPEPLTKGEYLVVITSGASIFKHKLVIS